MRLGARLVDVAMEVLLAAVVVAALDDPDRPLRTAFLVFCALWAYEAAFVAVRGATPGKAAFDLRVTALDAPGPPSWATAVRRGGFTAALLAIPSFALAEPAALVVFAGLIWLPWLWATLANVLQQGIADRVADTMVVRETTREVVTTRNLPGYADKARPPRLNQRGRVGDLDVRARARLRRLEGSPILVGAMTALAAAVYIPLGTAWALLITSALWIVAFVVDETMQVHRHGATPSHRLAALVVRTARTGEVPSTARSFVRALVLGLTLYVPVLWPLLGASMLMMRYTASGAGLHDLLSGTIVVTDPDLDPEEQRQRSMRMRLGHVGQLG